MQTAYPHRSLSYTHTHTHSYAPAQHQRTTYNRGGRGGGRGGVGHGGGNQQPNWYGFGRAGAQQAHCAPTPFKHYKNWNNCFLPGGNADNTHTSKRCGKLYPTHNRAATHANMMGRLVKGMHKSILPLAAGRTGPPTSRCPQQQQPVYHCPPISHMSMQGPAPPPAYYTGMPPAGGAYRQRTNMAFSAQAPGQVINCWAVSAQSRYRTNDATAHPTSKPDDDLLLCSQPTALPNPVPSQPAAAGILLLTSRGG